MLDDLVAHASVASSHVVLYILFHGRPVEAARKKFGCPVPSEVSCIGGVVMFCNEPRPEVRVLGDKQARPLIKHKVIFKGKLIC